jgi:putative transposase
MIRTGVLKIRGRTKDHLVLDRAVELCRQLYNAALQERQDAYRRTGRSRSFYDQCKGLTVVRADDAQYGALDATMLRLTALRRVDLAFRSFFRRVKAGETPGYPRYRSKGRFDTLIFGRQGWKLTCGKLRLNGIGTLRVAGKLHRDGAPVGLRITRRGERWYVGVLLDCGPAPSVQPSTAGVGIDVGLRTFATMSDGTQVGHPRFLRHATERLVAAGRNLSSKQRGSRRREKAKRALGSIHRKITNRRRDFCWQTAAALAKKYDGFAIENLDIAEMQSKDAPGENKNVARGIHRGVMDSAWGLFAHALACKAEEAGKPLVRVNPKGTSQRCSGCGSVVRKTLRDRIHDCPACGMVLDRDVNAARNIYDLGQRSAGKPAEISG